MLTIWMKIQLLENQPFPEINFFPSGNTPEIDLGAPPYDKILAE